MFILEIIIEFLLWILIEILLSYPGAVIIWLFIRPKLSICETHNNYRLRSVALSIAIWAVLIILVIKL